MASTQLVGRGLCYRNDRADVPSHAPIGNPGLLLAFTLNGNDVAQRLSLLREPGRYKSDSDQLIEYYDTEQS